MKLIAVFCLLLFAPLSLKVLLVSSAEVNFNSGLYATEKNKTANSLTVAKINKAAFKKNCKSGFSGFTKLIMSIPFALAEVLMTLASILHALLYLIGALIFSLIFFVLFLSLLILPISSNSIQSIWGISSYLFTHSVDWFNYLDKLNLWYNGNC